MATERLQIYKCLVCGIVVDVLDGGAGELLCCGEPMRLVKENTVDAAKEKHVPVVETAGDGIRVKVGSIAHPMEAKHFIEWIEVVAGGQVHRKFLEPGQAPEAAFDLNAEDVQGAREYCNLHGLWKS